MTSRQSRSSRAPGLRVALRRAMVPLIAATLGGAALAALPAQVAGAATRTTLWVSSTGTDAANNCTVKTSPCKTISHALTFVAPTGSNINVVTGSGPIVDQATISHSDVTINGNGASIAPVTDNVNGSTPSGADVRAVVSVTSGFTNVLLKNLTIDGTGMPAAAGCVAGPGHTGLYVRSASVTLSKVNVTSITSGAPNLLGCQNGLAVYVRSQSGPSATLKMSGGKVDNYQKNGITCNDTGTTCKISLTEVVGRGPVGLGDAAQNGIQFGFGGGGTINKAKVHGNNYTPDGEGTGILLYDTASNASVISSEVFANNVGIYAQNDSGNSTASVTLKSNNAHDAAPATNGFNGDGIFLDSVSNATVISNTVKTNGDGGIIGYGAKLSTIKSNHLSAANGTGIGLAGPGSVNATSTSNLVTMNTVDGSTADGIQATADATGNAFSNNTMSNNQPFDAHDSSSGGGTAGTANNWSGNACHNGGGGGSPAGICS
ncbi:MAG: Cna domain protein [Actinomycetia bacterium]|nr:Cna domain protein [Actinomycetes bacterium]